ncbi:MAG: hypothetical protein NZM28_00445, partial [Fimbriimonadales bacterium]|nr:hypothetical protein [Fimbriimonadales bacterium]
MRVLGLLGLLLWAAAWSQSPITRADLAVRLIEMESCWEAHRESQEARLRATRPLSEALTAFFSGRFDALARNLTQTCALIRSDAPPTPEMLYAGSLGVRIPHAVEKETLDRGELVLRFQLFEFYAAEKPQTPLQLRWKVVRRGETRPLREGALENPEPGAAATLLTQAAEGDYEVHFEIVQLRSEAQIPRSARNDRRYAQIPRSARNDSVLFANESLSFRAERGISTPASQSTPQVLRQWRQTFSV